MRSPPGKPGSWPCNNRLANSRRARVSIVCTTFTGVMLSEEPARHSILSGGLPGGQPRLALAPAAFHGGRRRVAATGEFSSARQGFLQRDVFL